MFPRFLGTSFVDNVEVEIPLNSGSQPTFKFDDQPNLRNGNEMDVAIQAIEVYNIFDVPLTPSGAPLPTDVQLQSSFLTLYFEGKEGMYRYPMTSLRRVANAVNGTPQNIPFVYDLMTLNNLQVIWEKSYITVPAGFGNHAAFNFMFAVYYLQLPKGTLARLKKIRDANYCNLAAPANS